MSVVVTGVAGFIGSHLATRLLADGNDVLGIDSFTDYYSAEQKRSNVRDLIRHPRFRLSRIDLAEADLAGIASGVTCIYHLAAQPGVRSSWGPGFAVYVRNNVIATQRLLDAIADSGTRVVFASSSSVYGEAHHGRTTEDAVLRPESPYGVSKLCSEQLVMAYRRASGLDARCVRYFTVYGPRQRPDMAFSRFIRASLRGETVELYGDGEQSRDFTFVADAVDASIRAGTVDDPGDAIFNVGGGSSATVRSVLSMIGDITGQPVKTVTSSPQQGDVRHTAADITRAREVLEWHPTVPLEVGLRAQVEAADQEP